MHLAAKVFGLALVAAAAPGLAQAELIFGLTSNNSIVTFDSATPGATLSTSAITGLGAGETLRGLDLRPMNGRLYSLSNGGNLYSLMQGGGSFAANLVGNIGVGLSGDGLGFDFNPVADRLRIVTSTNQNLRVNPDTGVAILPVDGTINPADLFLVGSAYTNSFAGAATTTLYGLSVGTGGLVVTGAPNAGTYTPVGPLGVFFTPSGTVNFDISGATGTAYANIDNSLYTLNLATGSATLVGSIAGGSLVGLTAGPRAVVPEPTTWAVMLMGFASLGALLRRRRAQAPTPQSMIEA